MAIDADIYKSDAASAAYVNPTKWSEQIEQVARQNTIMLPLGVEDNRALGTSGKQINIAKNQAFTVSALTEGVATPVSSMAFDQVTVTFGEYGDAKQISMAQLEYGLSGVYNDVTSNMGTAMAEALDNAIIDVCSAGAGATLYPNGHDDTDVVATDLLTPEVIADAITQMRIGKRNAKYLVITPYTENSLIKDADFVDASKYGGREVVMTGEVGKYLGVRVFSTVFINTYAEGASDAVPVYGNLLLGERPFVVGWKRKPRMQAKEDSILDRAITFSIDAHWGQSVLNEESIVLIKTAGYVSA